MDGIPCITGTLVPFRALLEYLEDGESLDKFLADFPSVTRERAVAALRYAGELALQTAAHVA